MAAVPGNRIKGFDQAGVSSRIPDYPRGLAGLRASLSLRRIIRWSRGSAPRGSIRRAPPTYPRRSVNGSLPSTGNSLLFSLVRAFLQVSSTLPSVSPRRSKWELVCASRFAELLPPDTALRYLSGPQFYFRSFISPVCRNSRISGL